MKETKIDPEEVYGEVPEKEWVYLTVVIGLLIVAAIIAMAQK